jgi:hypothetical protein
VNPQGALLAPPLVQANVLAQVQHVIVIRASFFRTQGRGGPREIASTRIEARSQITVKLARPWPFQPTAIRDL